MPCNCGFILGVSAFNIEAWISVCYKTVPLLGYLLSLLHRNLQKSRPCRDFRVGHPRKKRGRNTCTEKKERKRRASVKCAWVLTWRRRSKHYHMLRIHQRERHIVFVCILMQPYTHASHASVCVCLCNYTHLSVCIKARERESARVEWVDCSFIIHCWCLRPITRHIRLYLAETHKLACKKSIRSTSQRVNVLLTQSVTHSKCDFIMHNSSVGELCKKMHGRSENVFSRNCHHNPTFPG